MIFIKNNEQKSKIIFFELAIRIWPEAGDQEWRKEWLLRFGKIWGKVIARTSASPITWSDSPRCNAVSPWLRQASGRLCVSAESVVEKVTVPRMEYSLTILQDKRQKLKSCNLIV